jgi:hypothetical protein
MFNDLRNSIGNTTADLCLAMINTCVVTERCVVAVAAEGSRILNDLYSIDGLTAVSKEVIAVLRATHNPVFGPCIEAHEFLKDLYYSTAFIGKLVGIVRNRKEGARSPSKFCLLGADLCESGKFIQKNQINRLEWAVKVSERLARIKIFSYDLKSIPIANSFCGYRHPKDFFIFTAALLDSSRILYEWWWKWKKFDIIDGCKFANSVGKMYLIAFSNYSAYAKHATFDVMDIVTQTAALVKYIVERRRERQSLFLAPAT